MHRGRGSGVYRVKHQMEVRQKSSDHVILRDVEQSQEREREQIENTR
jgi:hypothetical protein